MTPLLQKLVDLSLLDNDTALSIYNESKGSENREEELILEKKLLEEQALFDAKSQIVGFPYIKDAPKNIPLRILEMIPEDSARHYNVIPLDQEGSSVSIGMVYPEDIKSQEVLRFLSIEKGFRYEISLIDYTTFNELLKRYKSLKQEVSKALGDLENEIETDPKRKDRQVKAEAERISEEAPISRIVAVLLRNAVEGKASDIHIEPTFDKTQVRFRLDGVLHTSIILPKKVHPAIVARIKILSNLKIDESRIPQDGRFSLKFSDKRIDFRVSTFPTSEGESVCLRILDPTEGVRRVDELGLIGRPLNLLKNAIKKPYGMILSTGPTGSGKTTTLYAILQSLDRDKINIMTLEDPVEYIVEGINQSQAKPDIGYTFASGLRSILRHDPNVIMVGEIRDHETADLAIHSALTGHLVLSTLHTNNAVGAIPRFINLGVESFLIPSSVNLVIGQRLVRKLCPECKEKVKPNQEVAEMILKELKSLPEDVLKEYNIDLKDISIYRSKGCDKCGQQGYSGRIGIFEIFEVNDKMAEIITKDVSEDKIKTQGIKSGMILMRQDGFIKVLQGITSVEEVVSKTKEGAI
ncbi:MAG TPA: GspE/PulE family protein [Candidatus Pacearchaeota archaeon]|nr:GspE/PulE family protein [Candidatus Pacearchaeota archaeon]HQI74520.1 GspE/PulE family protein [Candidatus Pacearchaeota archaeon]